MTRGFAERNGGRASLALLALILALGLGLRIDEAWEGREPVFDAAAYAEIAANLEAGEGFRLGPGATQPASNYSPGLPLLVAGLYEATGGPHERPARVLLALLGTLAVLFAYLIGRRLSAPTAGLVGAAAVAVYPALLEYQGMPMGEPLAATLLSAAVLAILWAADRDGRAAWLLPGALLGGLALVRPEYLGVAVLVALVVFLRGRRAETGAAHDGIGPSAQGLAQAAVLLAGLALVVAPWTIRNAIALDRFVPVSTGGGQVLFAGTYLPSGGDPERVGREVLERNPSLLRGLAARHLSPPDKSPVTPLASQETALLAALRLEQILAALAAERHPGVESDRALARMGREQLWDNVSEEPLEYAGFVAAKVWRIWSQGPRAVMREPGWRALHWALVALALLGLAVLAAQRRWEALLLATIFVAITAVSALLVASPRRVLVMVPLLAALAGVGASWLAGRVRKRPAAGIA